MFKPYGLTYTLVRFDILSNIPSGNELKGLSKMVLKIKYLPITKETIDSNCKSSRYQRSEIAGAVFFKNMFVFSSNTDQGNRKTFSSRNLSPFQTFKGNQAIRQITHNCSSKSPSKALLSIVLIALP